MDANNWHNKCLECEKPVADRVICAVDLGVNNDAVCSVLNSKGTVLARKFINRQAEKDHLNVMLKRKSLYICGKNP